jgi:hypothetical protein
VIHIYSPRHSHAQSPATWIPLGDLQDQKNEVCPKRSAFIDEVLARLDKQKAQPLEMKEAA